jgi:hypothetical protein
MVTGAPFNVRDFGAVGDGITDDTAAMNAAAAAAGAAKKSLFVPSGVYKMTAPWVVPIKVYVLGESMAVQDAYVPANDWKYGAIIVKAHTGNGIVKTGTTAYDEGAPIENITISSDATLYPGGNGFVIDQCSNVHLIRCNVYAVAGDAYVFGVTSGVDVTGHNYSFNCYSNTPGGVHYRVRQKWGRFLYPVTDGGTIGIFLDAAPNTRVDGFHFEGFSQIGIKISNGSFDCVFASSGFIGHTVATPVKGIQITNEAGNSNNVFENISFNANNIVGDEAVQLFANAFGAVFLNCKFNFWATGIGTSAGFQNAHTTIQNCSFYACDLPIYAAGDYTYILNNNFNSTVGSFDINHIAGTNGMWSGNSFDKGPNPALTGVQGNYGGIQVKNNTGFVSRNFGTTGNIAPSANIAHGLAGIPRRQIILGCNTSGVTSFPQIVSADATNFAISWTGAATAQWNWEAALPCDY